MSVTKAEFIKHMINSRPPYTKWDDDYSAITCIPAEIADAEVYGAWYSHVVEECGAGGDLTLAQIPKRFVTDDLRREAIRHTTRSLIYIDPSDTDGYEDLVLYGLERSKSAFQMMHDSLKTHEFLVKVIERAPDAFDLRWSAQAWIVDLLTQEMMNQILLSSVLFALSLPEDKVCWEQWKHLCRTHLQCPEILNDANRLDIFTRFLGEGNWPEIDPEVLNFKKTDDIHEIAGLATEIPEEYYEHLLYKAKLLTFPVEEIVAAMNTVARAEYLQVLFTEEVLRRHMKLNRALRGMFLENDLGM